MEAQEFLGLDVGLKRIGIARGSSLAKIAEPLYSVPTDHILDHLKTLLHENKAGAVVIGLPRNLSGDDSQQTTWVRQWAAVTKGQVKLPFYWQDEALTSVEAEELNKKYKSKDIDSLAAAIILQDFLDTPPTERILV